MRIIALVICSMLLVSFTGLIMPACAEEYKFTLDVYGNADKDVNDSEDDIDDSEDVDNSENGKETKFLAKKAKKKKKAKGQPKISVQKNNESVTNSVENNLPPPQEEQVPPLSPPPAPIPPFPCDASVSCIILDPMLSPEACQNQCQPGYFCQGRHDMRITHGPIAVCVPAQPGSMQPTAPSQ